MPNPWKQVPGYIIILLCGSMILLSLLVLWVGFHKPLGHGFEQELLKIKTEETIQPILQTVDHHLHFIKKTLRPFDENAARSLADQHFRIAEAILSRSERDYFPLAKKHLLQAIEYYPPLRHGWPYFTLGDITEKQSLQKPTLREEAIDYFTQVSYHDFGELALRAAYRIARIKVRSELSLSIEEIRMLHDYMRYVSLDSMRDLQPFQGYAWEKSENALFLKGYIEYLQKNQAQAHETFESVLQLNPKHYAAAFYRDQCLDRSKHDFYPKNGDLLTQYHAPRAFMHGSIRLLDDGRFFTDCYSFLEKQSVELAIVYESTLSSAFQFFLHWNGEQKVLDIEPSKLEGKLRVPLNLKAGQNRLSLHLHIPASSSALHHSWVKIKRLHLSITPGDSS